MRKALWRSVGMLAAAGVLGLIRPAAAQGVLPVGRAAVYATAPSILDRLTEIRVELAWLANVATFSPALEAHARGGNLEVTGYVPSTAIKARALQIAQQASRLPVVDRLQVHPGLTMRSGGEPVEKLQQGASDLLTREPGCRVSELVVHAGETGQVILEGVVPTEEDRLAASKKLKMLPGCTCVVNRLRVGSDSSAVQTLYAGLTAFSPPIAAATNPVPTVVESKQPIALVLPTPHAVPAQPATEPATPRPLPTLPVTAEKVPASVAPAPAAVRPNMAALLTRSTQTPAGKSEVLDLLAAPSTPPTRAPEKQVVAPPAPPAPGAAQASAPARPQRLDLEPTAYPMNSPRQAPAPTAPKTVVDLRDSHDGHLSAVGAAVLGLPPEKQLQVMTPASMAAATPPVKPTQLAAVDSRGSRFAESLVQQPAPTPPPATPLATRPAGPAPNLVVLSATPPATRPGGTAPSSVVPTAARNDAARPAQTEPRALPTALDKPQPTNPGARGVIFFDEDLPLPLPAPRPPSAPQPIAPAQLRLQVASVCGNLAREVQVLPGPDQSIVIRVKLNQPSARDELTRRIFSLPEVAASRARLEVQ
jgi:hypothetical protein